MVEWLSRLSDSFEIHFYSQRVEDLHPATFVWHRIPKLPLPHLLDFLWWLLVCRLWVGWHNRFSHTHHDVILSSGANFPGADAICVHIVFAEYVERVRSEVMLRRNSVAAWPRLIHRKLYYGLALLLENWAYKNPKTILVVNSKKSARELAKHYGREEKLRVVRPGIDHSVFSPEVRTALRTTARRELGLCAEDFAMILVGNDWLNKGAGVLLEVLEQLNDLPVRLLIVSREVSPHWQRLIAEKNLGTQVHSLTPRRDIEFYYAAADLCVAPSLQDAYSLPPAEAMACGLPVIVSGQTGVSEIIADGEGGLILNDPRDVPGLAAMIRRLYEDGDLRNRLGERAADTARRYTWESGSNEIAALLTDILCQKTNRAPQTLTQEP
jgi:glycosyltransferase involved in cell wall biosynthesis